MAMDWARLRRRALENSLTACRFRRKQAPQGKKKSKRSEQKNPHIHFHTDLSRDEQSRKSLDQFHPESHTD
jgi:hypothetical protein